MACLVSVLKFQMAISNMFMLVAGLGFLPSLGKAGTHERCRKASFKIGIFCHSGGWMKGKLSSCRSPNEISVILIQVRLETRQIFCEQFFKFQNLDFTKARME